MRLFNFAFALLCSVQFVNSQPTSCSSLAGTWYNTQDRTYFQITSSGNNQFSAGLASGSVQFVATGLTVQAPSYGGRSLSGSIVDWCNTIFWSDANRWKFIPSAGEFTFADLNMDDVALFEDASIGNGVLQINDYEPSSCGYAFYAPKVNVQAFNTSFTFRLTAPSRQAADGFAFIIQDFALWNTYSRGAVVFKGTTTSYGFTQFEAFPTANFAAMAWIKPSSLQTAFLISLYSSVDDFTYGAFGIGMTVSQNVGYFTVDVSSSLNGALLVTTNVTVDISTWQHVAVTYNSGSDSTATRISLFKNGILMWQTQNTIISIGGNPSLVIANKQNNQGPFMIQNGFSYSGAMADVQFTVVTTPNSINRSMSAPMFGYAAYYLDQIRTNSPDVLGTQNLTLQDIALGLDATLSKPLPMPNGGFLGYQGWPRSLVIEVDTWRNTDFNDAVATHISVQSRGVFPNSADISYSLGSRRLSTNLLDGKNHTISITYDGNYLLVYLDPASNGTSLPLV
eukprot:TRINITY_DN2983_c0_g3_i1.p1 TRINITY_DN2983_c0_g3~~TRINITY_DN2983_c0_g3_i1.p1  ORF type:complete len:528 (-),score=44.28 TRINITY_DN2983_c0_g3_i1:506-2032(-)